MHQGIKGVPIHGEFSSADAHAPANEAAARFSLYNAVGTAIAALLAAAGNPGLDNLVADVVIITDITLSVGATALIVQIFDGTAAAPAAGNLIGKLTVPANDTRVMRLNVPHYCVPGTFPKLLTNVAGQVDAVIHGTISSVGQ